MQVTILGAGTAIPAARFSPAGIYVQAGDEHLLLDAGAGSLQRLQRMGVTFLDLDRLFLTHFHPDHCLDLVSILFAMRLPQPARRKPFFIYGPRGLKRLYEALDRAFKGVLAPRTYRLDLKEIGTTRITASGYVVTTQPMNHSALCYGYRIESAGRVVAYSGDTDLCAGIVKLGKNADLLILECSMPDERKVPGHLTPSECGQIAAEAKCKRLVLTHFYPLLRGYDIRRRVRRTFRGPVILACDRTCLELS